MDIYVKLLAMYCKCIIDCTVGIHNLLKRRCLCVHFCWSEK